MKFVNQKQKAPAFYKNRPSDIDQSLLTVIPEAPRVAGSSYPKHWDWRILEAEQAISKGMKKASSANIDSAFGSAESTTKNLSRSMEQVIAHDDIFIITGLRIFMHLRETSFLCICGKIYIESMALVAI